MNEPYHHGKLLHRGSRNSFCGNYRYALNYWWQKATNKRMVVVGHSAEHGDNLIDSKRIESWIRCAEQYECCMLTLVNFYAYIGSGSVIDEVGPHNTFEEIFERKGITKDVIVVAAWGSIGDDTQSHHAVKWMPFFGEIMFSGHHGGGGPNPDYRDELGLHTWWKPAI